MSSFIDELTSRAAEAQKRLQIAQQEMQAAQARLQAVAQEFNSLQFLLVTETSKAQQKKTQAGPASSNAAVAQSAATQQAPDVNKTDLIRDVLKQHAGGITPSEIWKEVKGQVKHRAYLYSVLKRLRDRDEVLVKKNKYLLRLLAKPEAGTNAQTIVQ